VENILVLPTSKYVKDNSESWVRPINETLEPKTASDGGKGCSDLLCFPHPHEFLEQDCGSGLLHISIKGLIKLVLFLKISSPIIKGLGQYY
jgi:hypothetical protein